MADNEYNIDKLNEDAFGYYVPPKPKINERWEIKLLISFFIFVVLTFLYIDDMAEWIKHFF